LFIQIKNQKGRGAIKDAFVKLGSAELHAIKPESDDVKFVGLLLSFGTKMARSERYACYIFILAFYHSFIAI
jgi:hypothetical protein